MMRRPALRDYAAPCWRRAAHRAVLLLAAMLWTAAASAAFPEKAIRVLVPFPPGSGTDQVARLVGNEIARATGHSVVVENRPGASGFIATEIVAKAPADGYTILLTSNTHIVNKFLFRKLPYDPIGDFRSVSLYKKATPLVLVVAAHSPMKTLTDVTARAREGKLSFASGNTSSRVGGELYRQLINVDLLYVPYKGNPEALTDVAAGRVDIMFADASTFIPLVQAGKLRAIVSAGPERISNPAGIPTSIEAGLPGLVIGSWGMFLAPRATPEEVAERLNELVVAALKSEALQRHFAANNAEAFVGTRADLDRYMASEIKLWGAVITRAGIQPE